jgi:hypothetical protein
VYSWIVTPPNENGECSVLGVDLGTTPIWWDSKPDLKYVNPLSIGATIVLKIPGSTQWASRGEMKYYGAYFQILKVDSIDSRGNYVCSSVLDFPLRKVKE